MSLKAAAIPQHAPGAKLDAGKLRVGLMFADFACALEAVAAVTTFGAQKYTASGWRIVPDGVARYTDALHRHLLAHHAGEITDAESGLPHLAHAAWNALAVLELSGARAVPRCPTCNAAVAVTVTFDPRVSKGTCGECGREMLHVHSAGVTPDDLRAVLGPYVQQVLRREFDESPPASPISASDPS